MADRGLEIEIEIAQLKETVARLEETAKASSKASEATREHSKSIIEAAEHTRGFHKIIHSITEESPLAGLALQAMFSLPAAAIAGLLVLIHSVKKAFEDYKKAAEEAATENTKAFRETAESAGKVADEIHKGKLAHEEFTKKLADDSKQIRTELDLNIAKMKAETDAVEAINKAQGKPTTVGLAGEAEAHLTQAAVTRIGNELAVEKARESALSNDPLQAGRLGRADELTKFAQERRAFADQLQKAITDKETSFKNFLYTPGQAKQLQEGIEIDKRDKEKAEQTAIKALDAAARLRAEQEAHTKALEAQREKVKQLNDQYNELTGKLTTLKATTSIGQVGASLSGQPGVDPITQTIVRGAQALGGQITGSDGLAAQKSLGLFLAAIHENTKGTVDILRSHVNDVQALAADVAKLKAEAQRFQAQARGAMVP